MSTRSPLYEAHNASRYERQNLIQQYEKANECRLVVMSDTLFWRSITYFEETLYDADPKEDLHVMLDTPGGDGETAIRLVRQAQSRCKKLTVIVPDKAKSAGTLFALGADEICMGPTSDLGPVDPQLLLPDGSLAAAKAIIAAVEEAERRIQENPETYPLHASLLSDISALMVQQARNAIARAGDQLKEALQCAQRDENAVDQLVAKLFGRLIGDPQSHGAIISIKDAIDLGLPVDKADTVRWQEIWRMWAKYVVLGARCVYEGRTASVVDIEDPPTST